MKLAELLAGAGLPAAGAGGEREVSGIAFDSRQVKPGTLFVAIRGQASDGHRFAGLAGQAGAVAVVGEESAGTGLPEIRVTDSRIALAKLARSWNAGAADGLKLFGITGTNGKTTSSFLLGSVLESSGTRAAVLGTTGYYFPSGRVDAPYTTPESLELWALIARAKREGCGAVVMEVSSHALALHRTFEIPFDAVAFTNLTRDHLDFHRDFDDYREAKLRLFAKRSGETWSRPRFAAINLDDPEGDGFARASEARPWTFSRSRPATVRAAREALGASESRFVLEGPGGSSEVRLPLAGGYNVSNALTAGALALGAGLDERSVAEGLGKAHGVPGRMERVFRGQPFEVWVDYAHTPDALERVLATAREIVTGRLIGVFGCGGDRDPGKRPQMGAVATKACDFAVVTSDNPRTEDPQRILEDIRPGLSADTSRWVMEVDRARAIRLAIASARPGDGVVIAGKGHEDYQILGTVKHHFDDREVAGEALAWLGFRS